LSVAGQLGQARGAHVSQVGCGGEGAAATCSACRSASTRRADSVSFRFTSLVVCREVRRGGGDDGEPKMK
jgi:hypothetical protein